MPPVKIFCQHRNGEGATCKRFLAEIDGAELRIYCPRCKRWHRIRVEHLAAYLEQVQQQEEAHQAGAAGFVL